MKKTAQPPTLTIAFEGLMLFQTDADKRKQVALVNARVHNHVPQVTLWRSDAPNKPLQKKAPIELLDGDVVSFTNAEGEAVGGVMGHTDLYDTYVPKLRDFIFFGAIHSAVESQDTKFGGVAAYVDLPSGTITSWRSMDEYVLMHNKECRQVKQCFARYVVLATAMPSGGKLIIRHSASPDSQPLDLNAWDLVIVSNRQRQRGTHEAHSHDSPEGHSHASPAGAEALHFPILTRLLTWDGQLGPIQRVKPPEPLCNPEAGATQLGFSGPVKDILNGVKLRGDRSPNGDCGPTGP